jgi:hypothetical protein
MTIKDFKDIFSSFIYFIKLIFSSKKYDVVFMSTSFFNREQEGDNYLFRPLINFCIENELSYVVFEETYFKSYSSYKINKKSTPFIFISFIQIILRKLFNLLNKKPITKKEIYLQEVKISNILKRIFFSKFDSKVYITLIWNNSTLWRTINPDACIVDYQHGTIWNGHHGYLKNGYPPEDKIKNNITTFVHGDLFKNLLINNDKSQFYNDSNVIKVGVNKEATRPSKNQVNNKKILFTLQIAPDLNLDEANKQNVKIITKLLDFNAKFLLDHGYEIFFKHHPRFSKYNCPEIKLEHPFVSFQNKKSLNKLLLESSIHITFSSTSSLDAAAMSVPTIFIDMQKNWQFLPNDIFFKQYKYPCSELLIREFVDLKNILLNLEEKNTYNDISNKVNQWSENLYHDFDASIFGDFLIDKIGKSK